MKLPGMGEVSNKNVAVGGGIVAAVVLFAYWKKRKAAPVAATDGSTVDPNAIDPTTGIPYGQEAGGGGGYYTNASVANPYVTQTSTADTGAGGQAYTNNAAWLLDAEQYAVNQFGVNYALATTAFGKYLAQTASGLNPDEYQAVSETVALIGPPPTGTHRLIQAAPVQNPSSSGNHNPEPDQTPTPTPTPTQQPAALFSTAWASQHQATRGQTYSDSEIANLNADPMGRSVVGQSVGQIGNTWGGGTGYNIWDGHAWWAVNKA